ncbi:MAG: conjugal transfer protein TraG N-terminal domain-containing protein, partial [Pseudoalteromonas prydzensis]
MDFTIYSIGETAFLYEIIMGLRRMFDYGFSSLHILIGSVAGMSLLTLIVKSWINPNSNPVLSWFIGMIMFMILCGPGSKVDVTIESIRTGQVYYVSDAPGIVAIAALMTSGMYGLSRDYEDSFSSVNGYRAGQFLDPLRALIAIDRIGLATAIESTSNLDTAKYRVDASIKNYAQDCVLWDLNTGGGAAEITVSKLKNTPTDRFLDSLSVASPSRNTFIQLDSTDMQSLSCPQAYSRITSFLQGSFNQTLAHYYKANHITEADIASGAQTLTASTAAMAGNDVSRGRYLQNKLIQAAIESGDAVGLNGEIALMETTAQRHYQMAADRGLWLELAVGFATFLEAFVYFLVPLIAIMLVMGAESIKGAAMFFGVTIWVNLWPVTMSAINLFTLMAMEGRFTSPSNGGGADGSLTFGMFSSSIATVESYLAVASSLSAAVPMITLYILHRGVHTMMGVGNKTTPDTNINSEKLAPQLASAASFGSSKENNLSLSQSSVPTTGAQLAAQGGKYDTSVAESAGQVSSVLKSADANLQSAVTGAATQTQAAKDAQTFTKTATDSYNRTSQAVDSYKSGMEYNDVDTSNLTEGEAYTAMQAIALKDQMGLSTEDAMSVATSAGGQIAASASANLAVKTPNAGGVGANAGLGLSGGVKAELAARAAYAEKAGKSVAMTDDEQAQAAQVLNANRANAVSLASSRSSDNTESAIKAAQRSEALLDSYSQMKESSQSVADGAVASRVLGMSAGIGLGEVQNSTAGAGKETIQGGFKALDDNESFTMLSQLPASMVNDAVGGKPLTGMNTEEKQQALETIQQSYFDKNMDTINAGQDSSQLPQWQKDNMAYYNSARDMAAAIAVNGDLIKTDSSGNALPLSSPSVGVKQANTEASALGKMFANAGEELGSGSMINMANDLKMMSGNAPVVDPKNGPTDKTGIDTDKLRDKVSGDLNKKPQDVPDNTAPIDANYESNKGNVKTASDEGRDRIKASEQAVALDKKEQNMQSNKMDREFRSTDFIGQGGNALAGAALSSVVSSFADSVGENVSERMQLSGDGAAANQSLINSGYNILSNSTPDAINGLMNAAANGQVYVLNGQYLDAGSTKLAAGAVASTLTPEARDAFEVSKNSNEGQKYEGQPNNPYKHTQDNLDMLDNKLANNEAFASDVQKLGLVAQYGAIAGLDRGEIRDVQSAINGEQPFFESTKQEYGQHLENLNQLAELNGMPAPFDSSMYGQQSGDLQSAVLSGNYDSTAVSLAESAIQKYTETGSTEGANISDLNTLNRAEAYQTANGVVGNTDSLPANKDVLEGLSKIAKSLESVGKINEAEAVRSTANSLIDQVTTRDGYNGSPAQEYKNDKLNSLINNDQIAPNVREFASSVLFSSGDSVPSLPISAMSGLERLAGTLDASLPNEALQLRTAFLAQAQTQVPIAASDQAVEKSPVSGGDTPAKQATANSTNAQGQSEAPAKPAETSNAADSNANAGTPITPVTNNDTGPQATPLSDNASGNTSTQNNEVAKNADVSQDVKAPTGDISQQTTQVANNAGGNADGGSTATAPQATPVTNNVDSGAT